MLINYLKIALNLVGYLVGDVIRRVWFAWEQVRIDFASLILNFDR